MFRLRDLLGQKVAQRFTCIRDCLRFVDANKNGYIDKYEVRRMFAAFNMAQDQADLLFDNLDPDRVGEVSYDTFKEVIGQHIQPGHHEVKCATPRPLSRSQQARQQEADLKDLAEVVGGKAHQRFKNAREAFRFMDVHKDGRVTREGCRRFVEYFGFAPSMGDRLFDMACPEDSSFIDYASFIAKLGPFILPGHDPTAADVFSSPKQRERPSSARAGAGGAAEAPSGPAGVTPKPPSSERNRRPLSAGASRMRTHDSDAIKKRLSPGHHNDFKTTTDEIMDSICNSQELQEVLAERPAGVAAIGDIVRSGAPSSVSSGASVASSRPMSARRPLSAGHSRRPQSARAPTPPVLKGNFTQSLASASTRSNSPLASMSSACSGKDEAELDVGRPTLADPMWPPAPDVATAPSGAIVIRRRGAMAMPTRCPVSGMYRPLPGGGGGAPRRSLISEVVHAPLTRELMNSLGKTWSIL